VRSTASRLDGAGFRRFLPSLLLCLLAACSTTPEATHLPLPAESTAEAPTPGEEVGCPLPLDSVDAAPETIPVHAVELKGVRGGCAWFSVPGTVDEVRAMLLDFEHADGHRSWARQYTLLSRTEDEAFARWQFEGKLGVNPTVELRFDLDPDDPSLIRYQLVKPAFGLAAFFGDYRILPAEDDRTKTLVMERIFIASGLPFLTASQQDIEDGIHEDIRLMREWMEERTAGR